jgi:phenylacetate-CoA ligase
MLKIRGVIVFPTQIEDIIASTEGTVKEAWNIYIDNKENVLDQISVEIEKSHGCSLGKDELAKKVTHAIHSRLGIRSTVTCKDEGTLLRYEGKAVRVHIKKDDG